MLTSKLRLLISVSMNKHAYILLGALATTQSTASPYIREYVMVKGVRSDFLNSPRDLSPVVVKEDNGGDLAYHFRAVIKYKDEGRPVRIECDC